MAADRLRAGVTARASDAPPRGGRCVRVAACVAVLAWGASATARADDAPTAEREVREMPAEQAVAILGRVVSAPDGTQDGRLVDVLVDAAGVPQAAVIDFGGFMGVGSRKIAVHWSTLSFDPANAKQPITLRLTAEQIKDAPEYLDTRKPAQIVGPGQATAPPAAH